MADPLQLQVTNVGKAYGQNTVLRHVTFYVGMREILALQGPSGSGKSTLLRVIAGLDPAMEGTVRLGERDLTRLPAHQREVGMVFQELTLYPHMRVRDNLAFPLRTRGVGRRERRQQAEAIADLLDISSMLDRYPAELSGGERQRVAIGRALVHRPKVLLLDEPMSQLDPYLKLQLRDELRHWQACWDFCTIYVTHDADEAMAVADQLAILHAGMLVQRDSVDEVFKCPANLFVATMVGTPGMNRLKVRRGERGSWMCGENQLPQSISVAGEWHECVLGFRPHAADVFPSGNVSCESSAGLVVQGVVRDRYRVRHQHALKVDSEPGSFVVLVDSESSWNVGDPVTTVIPADRIFLFADTSRGERIHP